MFEGAECIECGSQDTVVFREDDGHFRKECEDCGYEGGPYVSSFFQDDEETEGQSSWSDW